MSAVPLGPNDIVPARSFSDPAETDRDTSVLEAMRAALGRRLASGGAGGRWRDPSGDEHLLVVPDLEAVSTTVPAVAVGFFGQARVGIDHEPILALERALLGRAGELPGLLAYHDVLLVDQGQWGNLVVFATDDAPAALAADGQHQEAIALTRAHYHSLRLHRYVLPDGVLGAAPLRWLRTTYLDFADESTWRAVRSAS